MSDKIKKEKMQEALWEGLHKGWVVDDSIIREKGSMAFRKSCAFFEAVLSEVEHGRWHLSLLDSDGRGPYETDILADTALSAKSDAQQEIFDILVASLATFGIRMSTTVPLGEIRMKQVSVGNHDSLYGVSDEGIVYERHVNIGGSHWERVDMKVATTPK